ncbi:AMP-binding protein [Moraxella haemolytica]|uniref:AMP-binding protein n=1 Tax=Moraxella TaxID=475 RepID=UPI0025428CA8|nr:AMP-binding protein [Moraxella sp. ZY171148]WII96276.1 AMP-binding protein [Moraxella sp. ZY171148]
MMYQKLSYLSGISDKPLIGLTIGEMFDRACIKYADKEAVVSIHQDCRLTYQQLSEQVNAFAASLLELGFDTGDRLGIWALNSIEWVITQYACFKIGVILVNLNPAYKAKELEYVLNKVECRGIVIADSFKTSDYHAMLASIAPELESNHSKLLVSHNLPHLKVVIKASDEEHDGVYRFNDLLTPPTLAQKQHIEYIAQRLQFDDVVNIQFTSGTTGNPKGTMLTHHNILNNGYFVGEGIKLTEDDRICVAVPLFHCFGMVMGNLAAMTHGATVIYPDFAYNPTQTLQAVHNERCTALYGVPSMFITMLEDKRFDEFDLSSLRTGIMAGSPCPREIMQRVIDRMHMSEITICYGMTETSPVSMQSHVDDPIDKRVSTVGQIHPHLEVKIVDEDGKITPVGVSGELCTRGYSVMAGYWGEPDKTKEVVDKHGWMHTGDIAEMDEDGFVKIKGRIKDVVIRGGENLFPKEIEDLIFQHPAVLSVQVVGLPDKRYGEELCACIILNDGAACCEDDIREFCRTQVSHHKVPRYVSFVNEFPMTASGKPQKFKLQELMRVEFNLTGNIFE